MTHCPTCGRPRVASRATCLYCGGPLPSVGPSDPVPADAPPVAERAEAGEPRDRCLVVLDLAAASEAALARALDRPSYEARLLVRRGGLHLHRIFDAAAADAEARRLRAFGLDAVLVPETEARVRPLRALGGERREGQLTLRTEEGPVVVVRRGDLLLVVAGPITREYQTPSKRRRVETARPDEGFRVHLHRREDPRPLEIDSQSVELGFTITGSGRLEVDAWVEEVAGDAPRDDGFRRMPPALSPSEPEPTGVLAAVRSLGRGSPDSASGGDDRAVVLDNVEQFRFYSAWRAAAERRRAGLTPKAEL